MEAFQLNAEVRTECGTSANRRLRRAGKVPAIIYGGGGDPVMLTVDHNHLTRHLDNEAFYSHIIKIKVADGKDEDAVLRDLHRHPARPFIEHMDLMRVVAGEALRMSVPLHFVGEEQAPGIVDEGGIFQHGMTEVEVECLPRDLPEYIEVDVSAMGLSDAIHLSEITVPAKVQVVELMHEDAVDTAVVSMSLPRAAVEDDEEADAAEAAEAEAGDAAADASEEDGKSDSEEGGA